MDQRTIMSLLRRTGLPVIIALVVLLGLVGAVGFLRPAHASHAAPAILGTGISVPPSVTVDPNNANGTFTYTYPAIVVAPEPGGDSDVQTPTCTADNGATSNNGFLTSGVFKQGITTVSCTAPEDSENGVVEVPDTGSFTVTVVEPAPVIAAHANITVNATSPAGAVVTYTNPAASEPGEPAETITVTCVPPSGSTFPIGNTLVTCTAKDNVDSGKTATTTFTVHVKGAVEQLNDLCNQFPNLTFGNDDGSFCTQLRVVIAELQLGQTNQACVGLTVITGEVFLQQGHILTVADAQFILTALARIQNVIGCPSNASFDRL